jgi:tricorn protease
VSATRVAFLYAGDLWSARLDGSDVRRLTTTGGDVANPVFLADGRRVAFSANYDGNVDVYVVDAGGGAPARLTWHPGPDLAQDATPDGRSVLFTSGRDSYTNRFTQLWRVSPAGGATGGAPEERYALPSASKAVVSPDGRRVAYNPLPTAFDQWKGYRGGRVSQAWLYDLATRQVEKVPQPEGRANDVPVAWIGDDVWLRSDRDGEFNLWRYNTRTRALTQVTRHRDFPVANASGGGGRVVYEQAGWLWLLDPASGGTRRLAIGVPADLRELRPRWVKGAEYVRSLAPSPSGARVAAEVRGEIVSVPAEKGDPRVLTGTPGAHERSPAWSPDGRSLAYVSDASGEYEIHVRPVAAQAASAGTTSLPNGGGRAFRPGGHGFYYNLRWSPDGRRIAYADNAQEVRVLDVATGRSVRVDANHTYEPYPSATLAYDWSPDGRWLAYTVNTRPLVSRLALWDAESGRSTPVTDGLSEVAQPQFDRSGKYLYVFASTNAGPARDWFAQSTQDSRRTRNVYAVVLRRDLPNPVAKESDEERAAGAAAADSASRGDSTSLAPRARRAAPRPAAGDTTGRSAAAPAAGAARVDLAGIETRVVALPVPAGQLDDLRAGDAGQLFYTRDADGKPALHRFDLGKRKDETVLAEAYDPALTRDGKKLLYRVGQSWFLTGAAAPKPGEGRLALDRVEVRAEPAAEWRQMFEEAWREQRDWFYDPKMHGLDWPAVRAKYAQFLPALATRQDLSRVLRWMASELGVGHSYLGGGDRLQPARAVPGGLLGADYEVADGRYRFRTVYGGLNWTPDLRAPLTEPGVNVRAGEYLLAVNGRPLRAPDNLFAAFENTADRLTDITVGPRADGAGARTVSVVPLASEAALRSRAWVERNVRLVDSLSGGRVAYVYVPNTAGEGFEYFKRYFYPQAHKEAIVVDERHNGGGQVADYYIDLLRRPYSAHWALRYGADLRTPAASIPGPKAVLIDETAGSGGDLFPWMFRKYGLGPLIGQRTWGGLVGILGYPVLMDGGTITAPNLAIWTPDAGFTVENEGVAPDIAVEQTPSEVAAGRDPQLLAGVAYVMEQLRKNPPAQAARPPAPDKSRHGAPAAGLPGGGR